MKKNSPTSSFFLSLLSILFTSLFLSACSFFEISATDQTKLEQASYSDLAVNKIEVDKQAPQFSLPNGKGEQVMLSDVTAEQPALVLFYRGDWCPFCISQLDSIKSVLPQLKQKGVQVIAISPDEQSVVQNTRRQFGQGFIFLSDKDSRVIEQFGIARDDKLPHPAIYLIKRGGDVAWFYASEDYKKRPTGEQLVEVINTKL